MGELYHCSTDKGILKIFAHEESSQAYDFLKTTTVKKKILPSYMKDNITSPLKALITLLSTEGFSSMQ